VHVSIQGNLNLESRQDSNHYDSKQTQAGAGFSVAIYGSGSSASANYSQNKAKVNYAQVEEQTGFHVGKGGMDVKVAGNTHFAGSVIDSEAAQDKNHFKTKSLTHTDIENHSEVEVKSVSAGLSTNMAQNAKNAMAAAASALGNKHESATSQTQSAIGSNIQIDTETPENLTALSRDTKNANHKVKAFDLQEIKEQQEAAQVAGELFSKITGDVAKAFEFEDGSKEKIAMHALAGALAAKMSGGNVATGAAAGAGSEWLNTYVTDYLNEHTKDLKLDAGQKEKLKQAAQQMTALAIGAAAGAVTGGTSETIKQGALASYNAETYNRQLHQNALSLIREKAGVFAQRQGISEEQALAQLTAEALRGVSDNFAYVEENAVARNYLNEIQKEAKDNTLFAELDRQSAEYRNSLINANYVTANQDLYNRVNRDGKKYATTTADYVLNAAIREGKSYYRQAGKETVSQVYGSARYEANRYRALEQQHANGESEQSQQLAKQYARQANSLTASMTENYQSGTALFDFSELYANKNPLAKTMFENIAESGYGIGVGGTVRIANVGIKPSQAVKTSNPHNPFLEIDKYGNEVYYRTMSEPDYKKLLLEGKVPATNETFISPLREYSQKYEGILVKFHVEAGTSKSLQDIGVVGNSATKREVFPNMSRAQKGWADNNQAQFKLEGRRVGINNGNGVVNTGLGSSEALKKFNNSIINFERINKDK